MSNFSDNDKVLISKDRIQTFQQTAEDRLAEKLSPINRGEVYEHLDEVCQNIIQVMDAFNIMKTAVNAQAEVLGLLRYTVQKYLPAAHLEEAATEYKALREKQIAEAAALEEEIARQLRTGLRPPTPDQVN